MKLVDLNRRLCTTFADLERGDVFRLASGTKPMVVASRYVSHDEYKDARRNGRMILKMGVYIESGSISDIDSDTEVVRVEAELHFKDAK